MPNQRRLLDVVLLALRPARWSIFGYRFVPLLLFAGGTWALVYGGFYHRIAVSETHEEQYTITVPVEPTMPPDAPSGMAPFSTTDAFGQPTDAPSQPEAASPPEELKLPYKLVQLVKPVKTTSEEREVAVNRAVTVAGIIRNEQGEIVRVGGAGDGPAFCPS